MSFVLPVWLWRIISALFSCSDSLVKTGEEEEEEEVVLYILHFFFFFYDGLVLTGHLHTDSHCMMICVELPWSHGIYTEHVNRDVQQDIITSHFNYFYRRKNKITCQLLGL